SAVFLSAWDLPADLRVVFEGTTVSEGYLRMTLELLRQAGMSLSEEPNAIRVAKSSRITPQAIAAEIDLSSAFSVAALAIARGGRAEFESWPRPSLQPDVIFPEVLSAMGCRVEFDKAKRVLAVEPPLNGRPLRGINCDLRNSPD